MLLPMVVLFFGVTCSVLPTSEDGYQCLETCYIAAAFPGGLEWCERLSTFLTCWKPCPSSRLDAVVQQETKIYQIQCSPNVTEEQREKFVHSHDDLDKRLSKRASHCEDPARKNYEARCKNVASCLLGSALDDLKADYPKDVVTAVADWSKAYMTWSLKEHISPLEACSFLYEPFKP